MIARDRVAAVNERLAKLGVMRDDLEEEFIRGSGPGGQKINKTSSTVRLNHEASGVEIKCQEERSLALNRLRARERLAEILESRLSLAVKQARQAREKIRRQTRQRSKAQKHRILADKRHRGALKTGRRTASEE
jgi:peptide chain release factor